MDRPLVLEHIFHVTLEIKLLALVSNIEWHCSTSRESNLALILCSCAIRGHVWWAISSLNPNNPSYPQPTPPA